MLIHSKVPVKRLVISKIGYIRVSVQRCHKKAKFLTPKFSFQLPKFLLETGCSYYLNVHIVPVWCQLTPPMTSPSKNYRYFRNPYRSYALRTYHVTGFLTDFFLIGNLAY